MTGYDIFVIILVLGLMFGNSGCAAAPHEYSIFVYMAVVFAMLLGGYIGLIWFMKWFKNTFS